MTTTPIVRKGIVVIGTSDTFESVEAAFDSSYYSILGYLAPEENRNSIYPRYQYLGDDSFLESKRHRDSMFVVTLYDNMRRKSLFARIEHAGRELCTLIHPSAVVMASAEIGLGSAISFFVSVASMAKIGRGVVARGHAHIAHDAAIGDFTFIGPGARILGRTRIGSGVMIGTGAIIFPEVTIGDGATVGAGAVVTKDVAAGAKVLSR